MAAPVIGLTGGIGSGKSTVADLLAELGARVIDADRIGHEVYRPGTEGHASVVAAFGPGVVAPDGTIDRRALGSIVFRDPEALARLNALVHPLIAAEVQRRVVAARAEPGAPPIVIEAAILIEAGWRFFDRIWAVTAPREAAIARVMEERGLSHAEVERRMAVQTTDEERRRVAHVVIDNGGTRAELRRRVEAAWQTLGR